MNILDGFVGVIIGFVASYILLRFNYKDLYAKTVTYSRENSNNILRENISNILAICRLVNKFGYYNEKEDRDKCINNEIYNKLFELYKSISICKMMMSIRGGKGNEYHTELTTILDCISNDIKNEIAVEEKHIIDLEIYTRCILDYEWIRIKNEAKGLDE